MRPLMHKSLLVVGCNKSLADNCCICHSPDMQSGASLSTTFLFINGPISLLLPLLLLVSTIPPPPYLDYPVILPSLSSSILMLVLSFVVWLPFVNPITQMGLFLMSRECHLNWVVMALHASSSLPFPYAIAVYPSTSSSSPSYSVHTPSSRKCLVY